MDKLKITYTPTDSDNTLIIEVGAHYMDNGRNRYDWQKVLLTAVEVEKLKKILNKS